MIGSVIFANNRETDHMRRFLLITGMIIFVFASVLPAQWLEGFHVLGGLKYSTISWDSDSDGDTKYRLGIEGGMGIEREYFGFPFVARVLYLQHGAKWEDRYSDEFSRSSSERKIRLSYLAFPVMIKYAICDGYLLGGLQTAFLLGAKEKWKWTQSYSSGDSTFSESDSGDDDVKNNYSTFDFGLVLGGGMAIPCAYAALTAEVMYFLGLTNIWDGDDGSKRANRSFNIALNYAL
jgi:hypothetical protein